MLTIHIINKWHTIQIYIKYTYLFLLLLTKTDFNLWTDGTFMYTGNVQMVND